MSRAALHMHTLVYVCVSWHLLAFVFLQSALLFDGIMSVISHLQIVVFTRFRILYGWYAVLCIVRLHGAPLLPGARS